MQSEKKIEEFRHLFEEGADNPVKQEIDRLKQQAMEDRKYDTVIVVVLACMWLALVVYANFFAGSFSDGDAKKDEELNEF